MEIPDSNLHRSNSADVFRYIPGKGSWKGAAAPDFVSTARGCSTVVLVVVWSFSWHWGTWWIEEQMAPLGPQVWWLKLEPHLDLGVPVPSNLYKHGNSSLLATDQAGAMRECQVPKLDLEWP